MRAAERFGAHKAKIRAGACTDATTARECPSDSLLEWLKLICSQLLCTIQASTSANMRRAVA